MNIIDFVRQYPQKTFTKGELLLSEGDFSTTLLAVAQGFVKVTSVDTLGNQRMLWIAGRYDIVPTERLFSRSLPLQFFYTALSDGVAYRIDKADFLRYAADDITVMSEVAETMSTHYDDLLLRIHSIEQTSIREKLIATLQYLAKRFSASQTVDLCELGLRITHQDIADMIGSTRETTSLELKKLQNDGYLTYDRNQFCIHLDRF